MNCSPPRRPGLPPVAFIKPCIPSLAKQPPAGPAWMHEIKHDGYRLMVWRFGERVRLFTRRGYDWTDRYPRIVNSARKLRAGGFLIDGEAVVVGENGISDFQRLHSREHDDKVFVYAFDLLSLDGADIRHERLDHRRGTLRLLLADAEAIVFSDAPEGDSEVIFRHACSMGLEGIVSKRRDSTYRSGRSKTWLKIMNPDSPAARRHMDMTR